MHGAKPSHLPTRNAGKEAANPCAIENIERRRKVAAILQLIAIIVNHLTNEHTALWVHDHPSDHPGQSVRLHNRNGVEQQRTTRVHLGQDIVVGAAKTDIHRVEGHIHASSLSK